MPKTGESLVNETLNFRRLAPVLLLAAAVLTLTAWLRGAEYDEQYSLFLTAGTPRPLWPDTPFPAGLAKTFQAGGATLSEIGRDLRVTDVHPPLYFWLLSLWRAVFGPELFAARLLSVGLALGALACTGAIARQVRIPPSRAMLLTLGCYAFAYTGAIARGFALAQFLLLAGYLCLSSPPRYWRFVLGGLCLGAASFSNYLAVFVACATLAAAIPRALALRAWTSAIAALVGFCLFLPLDLLWFLAQRGSRTGQFPPFSAIDSLFRLAARGAGAILGGLPLYVGEPASQILAAALGLLLLVTVWRIARGLVWTRDTPLVLAVIATPAGLLLLGALFDNTPIEIRYLAFAMPFAALLAATTGPRLTGILLTVQAASLAGLMLAPQTMQPARAAAWAAASLAGEGIVLLPRGNDGVGVVGAFAIESPPDPRLLLIRPGETPSAIRARAAPHRRVVLALLEQDDASRAAATAMRQAFDDPGWREVARRPHLAVYERIGDGG